MIFSYTYSDTLIIWEEITRGKKVHEKEKVYNWTNERQLWSGNVDKPLRQIIKLKSKKI